MRRFALAICPRASFLDHVTLSVQEYGRLPSADRGTSLRSLTAGRGGQELGKKNQSLNVSYAIDSYHVGRHQTSQDISTWQRLLFFRGLPGHGSARYRF